MRGTLLLWVSTEQDVISGSDAPHARLSRELLTRARTVRALACDIQRTLQNIHSNRQHQRDGHDSYSPERHTEGTVM